jgi:hypothetical protein
MVTIVLMELFSRDGITVGMKREVTPSASFTFAMNLADRQAIEDDCIEVGHGITSRKEGDRVVLEGPPMILETPNLSASSTKYVFRYVKIADKLYNEVTIS